MRMLCGETDQSQRRSHRQAEFLNQLPTTERRTVLRRLLKEQGSAIPPRPPPSVRHSRVSTKSHSPRRKSPSSTPDASSAQRGDGRARKCPTEFVTDQQCTYHSSHPVKSSANDSNRQCAIPQSGAKTRACHDECSAGDSSCRCAVQQYRAKPRDCDAESSPPVHSSPKEGQQEKFQCRCDIGAETENGN